MRGAYLRHARDCDLCGQGDPLEKLAVTVDLEIFRFELVAALRPRDRSKGSRPSIRCRPALPCPRRREQLVKRNPASPADSAAASFSGYRPKRPRVR